MRPVTLMTHPHLLSLLLSLNKGFSSYLPMALGNFAHNYGQSCSSLWVNLPIVVGKLHSFLLLFLCFQENSLFLHHNSVIRFKRRWI